MQLPPATTTSSFSPGASASATPTVATTVPSSASNTATPNSRGDANNGNSLSDVITLSHGTRAIALAQKKNEKLFESAVRMLLLQERLRRANAGHVPYDAAAFLGGKAAPDLASLPQLPQVNVYKNPMSRAVATARHARGVQT